VADVDPALGQQILDVAQGERKSHIHHHDQADTRALLRWGRTPAEV
jgi:hypothetical protein